MRPTEEGQQEYQERGAFLSDCGRLTAKLARGRFGRGIVYYLLLKILNSYCPLLNLFGECLDCTNIYIYIYIYQDPTRTMVEFGLLINAASRQTVPLPVNVLAIIGGYIYGKNAGLKIIYRKRYLKTNFKGTTL